MSASLVEPASGQSASREMQRWLKRELGLGGAGLGLRLSPAAAHLGTVAEQVRIPASSPGWGSGWRDLAQAAPSPAH